MPRKPVTPKRRISVTLSADSRLEAGRIADSRRAHLSTVITERVVAGLQPESARQRTDRILDMYRSAFSGFSEDELAIVDGVLLDPVAATRRRRQ